MVAKAVMAVSGLMMVGFLIMHAYGNTKIFYGADAFNHYSEWLREAFYPILPHEGLLWIMRIVLLAAILAHIWSAVTLASRNRRAAGGGRRYASSKAGRGMQRTFASRTLLYGGFIIAGFLVFHLLHLTAWVVRPSGTTADATPYERMVTSFAPENWWVTLIYVITLIALLFHLRHGFWSALTTLGANTSAAARRNLNILAWLVAIAVVGLYLVSPLAITFGLVK